LHDGRVELDEIQRAAQQQFARQSQRYGRGHILENVEDVAAGLQRMTLPPKAGVLDVATGAGHTGLYLASLGHDVTVSDLARAMLDRTAQMARERGLNVQVRQHAAEVLPYGDGFFDLVTCRVAAHHFSSPGQFVTEVSRVLAASGYFLLIDGTVQDGEPEAEEWMHKIEKLRDPSHHHFLTPNQWSDLCREHGLAVQDVILTPFKQPDLNWYFETANTSPQNRERVLELIAAAPNSAHRLFRLGQEDGKIVWWWQRLTLIARKAAARASEPAGPLL
jgi:ubiquinone/menaquinone biosynthesis C-methylase UbiE